MANEEQLSILKQGVEVWNRWRDENPDVGIDFSHADLTEFNLNRVNFSNTNLVEADLGGIDIIDANLSKASLIRANLCGAVLGAAKINNASLYHAALHMTNLFHATLVGADLTGADLGEANLKEADLREAILDETKFSLAIIGHTIFGNVDLIKAIGLDEVRHSYPSTIGTDTLARAKGKIPEVFLRGCGLSDADIEYSKLSNSDLSNEEINKILYRMYELRATQALQISPLFISYSHADGQFVDKLEGQLNKKGVRFWRDIHNAKAGRLEKQIDRAISQNRTVLLILSEHSLNSDWVEHEVRMARGLEKDMGRDVLCPIALDDSWKSSPWPKWVMEQIMEYNILDFSAWEDDVKFEGMFRKLIDGLELFYKG